MDFVIQVSYGSLAVIYSILLILIFIKVSGQLVWYFRAWCLSSILWAAAVCYSSISPEWLISHSWSFEVLRNLSLALLLFKMLPQRRDTGIGRFSRATLVIVLVALLVLEWLPDSRWLIQQYTASDPRVIGMLVVSIALMIALEQLYVSIDPERLWAVKHFFLALLALLLFDFFLYVEAFLYQHLNDTLLASRGIANLLVIPLFVLAGLRNPHWDADFVVSRHVAFRAVVLTLVGGYLLIVSIAAYYVRDFGGRWGEVLLILLLFGSVTLLVLFLVSGRVRSALSVIVAKNFFKLKYDYRYQWMSITKAMNSQENTYSLQDSCLKVMADSVDSRGAVLWRKNDNDEFLACGFWNMPKATYENREISGTLISFLQSSGWVVDLHEYRSNPEKYPESCDVAWFGEDNEMWLIVPLLSNDSLYGVIALASPRIDREIGWEDHDFLKLLAQQVYSYLSLTDAHEALSEAKQFEAFHRISAFVVHDIKNVSAQLSVMLSNMDKHKRNPDFIDDCIDTLSNSVSKMDRMLMQLSGNSSGNSSLKVVDVGELLRVIAGRFVSLCFSLKINTPDRSVKITIDEYRFSSAIENIIKNAIEAAGENGEVKVWFGRDSGDGRIHVNVSDNGPGMSKEFINNSLFHAFHTTKGNAGMGIGLFDAKEFMKSIGGRVKVDSNQGVGTVFSLIIPESCELG